MSFIFTILKTRDEDPRSPDQEVQKTATSSKKNGQKRLFVFHSSRKQQKRSIFIACIITYEWLWKNRTFFKIFLLSCEGNMSLFFYRLVYFKENFKLRPSVCSSCAHWAKKSKFLRLSDSGSQTTEGKQQFDSAAALVTQLNTTQHDTSSTTPTFMFYLRNAASFALEVTTWLCVRWCRETRQWCLNKFTCDTL